MVTKSASNSYSKTFIFQSHTFPQCNKLRDYVSRNRAAAAFLLFVSNLGRSN